MAAEPSQDRDEVMLDESDGDASPAVAPKAPKQRSEFLLKCNEIRLRLRLKMWQWAVDHAGCSPQEWSRFWNLDRRVSKRVETRLLVLYPELRKPWLRSLQAARPVPPVRPAPRSAGPGPGG
jgi:hypothetical protein